MKYICMGHDGKEEIFTFSRDINHDCMAEVLSRIKNHTHGNWRRVFRQPISAGFVTPNGQCIGESDSLGLSSRPQDTEILRSQF